MSIDDIIKIQEGIKNLQIHQSILELNKSLENVRHISHILSKTNILTESSQISKSINSFLMRIKNFEGMNSTLSQYQDIIEAIKNKATFLEYSIDLHDIELYNGEPQHFEVKINETRKLKNIILDVYKDNKILFTLSTREFEEMIAELLSGQGFKVELTKQTRDNGYDIIALKFLKNQLPLKFLVECKRFSNRKIGVEIVRSFKDVILTEKANRGIIVTTSYFSRDAQKKQQETPYLLDYRDKDNVIEWVAEYYREKISR